MTTDTSQHCDENQCMTLSAAADQLFHCSFRSVALAPNSNDFAKSAFLDSDQPPNITTAEVCREVFSADAPSQWHFLPLCRLIIPCKLIGLWQFLPFDVSVVRIRSLSQPSWLHVFKSF